MKKDFELTQNHFDNLLIWLSADRQHAGEKYEEIRKGLIKFFRFKGCSDPESLTDETISRVAAKVSAFSSDNHVKTITYFYGFAAKIYLESVSRTKIKEVQLEPELLPKYSEQTHPAALRKDLKQECLENCLAELPSEQREIILQYYSSNKKDKFEARRKMAESMNLSPGALHTKIHRIKTALKKCIKECVGKKDV